MHNRFTVMTALVIGCTPQAPSPAPAPPPTTPASATAGANAGTLHATNVSCTYGGAVPGIFVFFDATATEPTRLTAVSYEIKDASGAFVQGAIGTLELRRWSMPNGGGSIVAFDGAVAAKEVAHLQLFGRLETKHFDGGYPSEPRDFRAIVRPTTGAPMTITGRCLSGPAG